MDLPDDRDGAARTPTLISPGPGPAGAEILLAVHAALLDLAAPPDDEGFALSAEAAVAGRITARRVS